MRVLDLLERSYRLYKKKLDTDIDAIAEPLIVPKKINKKFSFSNSTL